MAELVALDGVPRSYPWGSPTAIPILRGDEPDGTPMAELWFGAHPDGPSPVPAHALGLDELIAADPVALLGERVVARFGPRLPFLVKLLAARTALSIQVHPTIEQAEAGFAAEDAAGIARTASNRNYRDRNHKPELLCALTEFEALCGFRPVAETLRLLDALGTPELGELRGALAGDDGLRAGFTLLLAIATPQPLVAAVRERAAALAGTEWAGAARAVALTAADFPADIGVVLSLLLNYVRLAPGEAIYLGAGSVHSYLRGLGVEVMANSDNVLRCGLTGKHIDVDQLLAVTDFAPLVEPRMSPERTDSGAWFELPVPDFRVGLAGLDGDHGQCAFGDAGLPYLAVCVSGLLRLEVDGDAVTLTPGRAAFVKARRHLVTATGTGEFYYVTVDA
jgi:mannose-6-phosphate isomerase